MKHQLRVNDVVVFKNEPEDSINYAAKVNYIYANDNVWVANLNMPFAGTISEIFSPEQLEEIIDWDKTAEWNKHRR